MKRGFIVNINGMQTEIERKFLVAGNDWKSQADGRRIRQGYLSVDPARNVRVRLAGEHAWLTLKGTTTGVSRAEYEYPIPPGDAEKLLETMCLQPLIDKTRYTLCDAGQRWEIDEFHGANAGLVIAEIELENEDQAFDRPAWLGAEVSDDPRYYNANLLRHPFRDW